MAQEEQTGGTGVGHRTVSMTRLAKGSYAVTNVRGGTMTIGEGDPHNFTPVELLLAAIGGCSATDVDYIVAKRAEPLALDVVTEGDKVRDDDGNHMSGLTVSFTVTFPDGPDGDRAREMLPRAVAMSHDRLCTVTRTVLLATEVESRVD